MVQTRQSLHHPYTLVRLFWFESDKTFTSSQTCITTDLIRIRKRLHQPQKLANYLSTPLTPHPKQTVEELLVEYAVHTCTTKNYMVGIRKQRPYTQKYVQLRVWFVPEPHLPPPQNMC